VLDDFDLDWWTKALKPICHEFAEAAAGRVDLQHWSEIIKKGHTYGTDLIDGWLAKLIPYTVDYLSKEAKHRNGLLAHENQNSGISPSSLPKGLSLVPFTLQDNNSAIPTVMSMEFIAGLAWIGQTHDGALEARMGWAVRPRPGLASALDELERRGLFLDEKVHSTEDGCFRDSMAAEIMELQDRCRHGARLCTKSGHVCGRLFPTEEYIMTRYGSSVLPNKNQEEKHEGEFQTKLENAFDRYRCTRHPDLGFVAWRGIGELDGKFIGIKMHHSKNKVFLFSVGTKANDYSYELTDKDLSTLIREVLDRQ
jgi:hypothetical protein